MERNIKINKFFTKMKIDFITLSTNGRQIFSKGKKYALPIRGALIKAITPSDVELDIQDENFAPIDTSTSADVIAISLNTPIATRAYSLGASFSQQGKIVVYGGPHISQVHKYPDFRDEMFEVGGATVAFIGDAEATWPKFIEDLRTGTVQKMYQGSPFQFDRRIVPDRDFLRGLIPAGFAREEEITSIESSRGCPHLCTYCSTNGSYIDKPILDLEQEINKSGSSAFSFADSNITHNQRRLDELTAALTGLGITYATNISSPFINENNIAKLAESGCNSIYVGFDSINPASLKEADKPFNDPSGYTDTVKLFHKYGISVIGAVIFGFDNDYPDVFERTWDFIEESGLDQVSFHVLIPYPGTPLFDRLRGDGRLLYTNFPDDWRHYSYDDVAYRPLNMSPEMLLEKKLEIEHRFRERQTNVMNSVRDDVLSTNVGRFRV
jgi:radical SAM superfamily enzyme YgiQ (UPF0313 family)